MYLAFDTETTGITPSKHNLLTVCFIYLNEDLEEIDRLNLSIKYNDYTITIKAMEINKIDLIKHNSESLDLNKAREQLLSFLKKHKKRSTFTPIGHNIAFDINFIKGSGLLTEDEYNDYFTYNTIDTISIARYLKLTGDLPKRQSLSLQNLCNFYKLSSNKDNFHTAEYDIEMTVQLLRKFKSINDKLSDL